MALLRLLLLHSIALPVVRGLQLRAPARHLRAARRPTAAAAPHHERTRLRARNDDAADPLEARLDVTVLWCHCLARELFREVSTNPPKAVPGFTVDDLSALWALVASASCLSVLWGAFGLATRQFAPAVLGAGVRQFSTGRPRTAPRAQASRAEGLARTAFTCAAAAPLWLAFESAAGAPAAADGAPVAAAAGLLATMSLARLCRSMF